MPRTTSDALEILEQMYPLDERRKAALAEIEWGYEIAQALFDAREAAGLTRGQLARKMKIKASVIEDVEENDYAGNSLEILRNAATALNLRLDLVLTAVPDPVIKKSRKSA